MKSRLILSLVLSAITLAPALGDDVLPYRITIKSGLTMKMKPMEEIKIDADTKLSYDLSRRGDSVDVIMKEADVRALVNGAAQVDVSMSRERFVDRTSGTTIELADAAPELKTMLQDSFDTPLCTYKVDKNNKELDLKLSDKAGAANFLQNGQVENARLFHVQFPGDADGWESESRMSMGNGNFATGKLKYVIAKDDKLPAHQKRVNVSGKLEPKGSQNGLDIKDGSYNVTGTQVYDTKLREWVSGDLKIKVSFKLMQNDTEFASAAGEMNVGLTSRK